MAENGQKLGDFGTQPHTAATHRSHTPTATCFFATAASDVNLALANDASGISGNELETALTAE